MYHVHDRYRFLKVEETLQDSRKINFEFQYLMSFLESKILVQKNKSLEKIQIFIFIASN